MRREPSRRQVLGTIGTGTAISIAGCLDEFGVSSGDTDPNSDDNETNDSNGLDHPDRDFLVLIYDDSPAEDYTKAFPAHEEYGVPGCAAVCPGLMGTASRWLHPRQLEEMHGAGWEVMSHTLRHRALGEIPIRGDISPRDTEIHVQSNLQGRFEGDPLVIRGPENEATVTVAGMDERNGNDYILLDDFVGESFEAGDGYHTWVRYTDDFTQQILEESRDMIEEWGMGPVTAYVHTYNRYDGYVSEVVPDFYDTVPNRHGDGLNPTWEPDPFNLGRYNFEDNNMTDDELESVLDSVVDEHDFGILYGHTDINSFSQERIENTIELALERDIEIVTLHEALTAFDVF